MAITENSLWLVTGCSTGLGRAIAAEVVRRGHRLIATARDAAGLAPLVATAPHRVRAMTLDVTDPQTVVRALRAAEEWGGLDVLVNNAGYGYLTTVEQGDDGEIRRLFETNFFGAAALIRGAAPALRARRRGAIINVSSIAGFVGGAGSGYYAATKFALEGLTDSLYEELRPLGITVMSVQPGPVRTDFAGRSIRWVEPLPDYAATAGKRHGSIRRSNGRQSGDPQRIAELVIDAACGASPPRHLFLGDMAMLLGARRADEIKAEIEEWRGRSAKTDFPDSVG